MTDETSRGSSVQPAPGPAPAQTQAHEDDCGCGHDHSHDHGHHHHGHHHHAPVETYTRGAPKVGRNDACPCGSGKKYKKCCLAA
jgi:preprotein translocase subunit SecA